jgi:Tol biopolymer transport system component
MKKNFFNFLKLAASMILLSSCGGSGFRGRVEENWLLYSQKLGDVSLAGVLGTQKYKIPISRYSSDMKWSPDGNKICYVNGGDIYIYDLEKNNEKVVVSNVESGPSVYGWYNDGKIYYWHYKDGGAGVLFEIRSYDTYNDRDASYLEFEISKYFSVPSFEVSAIRNSKFIAYVYDYNYSSVNKIYTTLYYFDSNNVAYKVANDIQTPHFSPDGRFIAFGKNDSVDPDNPMGLYLFDTDRPNIESVRVSSMSLVDQWNSLSWSSDSTKIVYSKGSSGLQICNIGSKEVIKLNAKIGYKFVWSPDGSKIAYISSFPSGIRIINSDGSNDIHFADAETLVLSWQPKSFGPGNLPTGGSSF